MSFFPVEFLPAYVIRLQRLIEFVDEVLWRSGPGGQNNVAHGGPAVPDPKVDAARVEQEVAPRLCHVEFRDELFEV